MKITVGVLEWPSPDGGIKRPVIIEVPHRERPSTYGSLPEDPEPIRVLEPTISAEEVKCLAQQAMAKAEAECDAAWEQWNKEEAARKPLSEEEILKMIFG